MNKEKVMYLDVVRIIATMAVIVIHVSTFKIKFEPIGTYNWTSYIIFDALTHWAVPMFCMISGALFLDNNRNVTYKKLYSKNIPRIITAFLVWSTFYAYVFYSKAGLSFVEFAKKIVIGHYHMWYLFMIVGFYIMVPILRKITDDKNVVKYFIGVCIAFTFAVPAILNISQFKWASVAYNKTFIFLPLGYTIYFLIGYYINKFGLKTPTKVFIYITGPLALIGMTLGTYYSSVGKNASDFSYMDYNSFTFLLSSIFIFVLIKDIVEKINFTERGKKLVSTLSKDTFGIYLIHVYIIYRLDTWAHFSVNTINPYIAIPVICVLTYFIGEVISHILNKIPVINKYIV